MPMPSVAPADAPFARLADGHVVTAGRRVPKGLVLCAGLLAWWRYPVLGLTLGDLGDAWRRTTGFGAGFARFSGFGAQERPLRFTPGRTDV